MSFRKMIFLRAHEKLFERPINFHFNFSIMTIYIKGVWEFFSDELLFIVSIFWLSAKIEALNKNTDAGRKIAKLVNSPGSYLWIKDLVLQSEPKSLKDQHLIIFIRCQQKDLALRGKKSIRAVIMTH